MRNTVECMAGIDTFTPLEKGLYIVESTFKEKMSGPFKGKTDEAIRHRTTITLSVRSD